MKKILFILVIVACKNSYSQGFSEEKNVLTNFIKRMYSSKPFEGVKIIDDYNRQYLVSVIALEKAKYTSESVMSRVAQVKAQSQASTFLNGSSTSMDILIITKEAKDSNSKLSTIVETIEQIKQNSFGFSKGLELLTNFDSEDNLRMIFIYIGDIKTK